MQTPNLFQSLTGISDWFNKHKGLLVVIGMPIGGAFTYAYNNVVMADEYKAHVVEQGQKNSEIIKAVEILNYEFRLATIRDDIEFILQGRNENELSSSDRRRLDRLYRDEQRYEQKLTP